MYLSQDEIRHLNSDFNYKHYGQYYEKLEEDQLHNEGDGEHPPAVRHEEPVVIPGHGLELSVAEDNLLHQMWKKVTVEESFYNNYEQWLEDEVWGYYD